MKLSPFSNHCQQIQDTAPDIYETPELTDDNSTVLTTTGRSPSDESDDNDDDDDVDTGISRSRVQVDQARSRFMGSTVDARGVDFSDRVDGKRKSYRTATSARRRRRQQQQSVLGDVSDADGDENEDDEEEDYEDSDSPDGLERKIARLKREVEEAKAAYSRLKTEAAAKASGKGAPGAAAGTDLDSLSQALDDIARLADEEAAKTAARPLSTTPAAAAGGGAQATETAPTPAPSAAGAHALAQTADFDRRLVLLERSIGIEGGDGAGLPRAILPTLDALQRQIGTLADASTASLDGISRRVRTLAQEADQLAKSRQAAKAAQEALADVTGGASAKTEAPSTTKGDDGDDTKINALYGTLPTIEQLAPLLPPLLDRLRSLRAIHADAAGASELLDELAQQQSDTAAEVKQWRQGLETMEAALRDGEATMGMNAQVMEGWVKELEARLDKLA